jgi:hypothetical protein
MKLDEASPFTTLIPQSPLDPIVIYNDQAALRMAIVDKEAITLLGAGWERPGVYLLLYPIGPDGVFDIYVGKASTGGLRSRMLTHKNVKPGWTRAFLITRDTTHGYNSAHVGWLEGRLWSLVKAAARAHLVNGNQPGTENLPAFDRATLELAISPIRQVMRLLGYSLAPEDEVTPVKAPGTKHYHGVKLIDLINAELLAPGATVEFTWTGFEGTTATIEADGRLLLNGVPYSTPSAAGGAVRGGIVNGWEYWAIRDANKDLVSLAELRAKLPGTGAVNGNGQPVNPSGLSGSPIRP